MPPLPHLQSHRSLSHRVRRVACWTIAATLLGLPVWLLSFAHSQLQIAVFAICTLVAVLALLVAAATVAYDAVTAAIRGQPLDTPPRWRLLLVLCSPLVWLITVASDLPAQLWLWRHEGELERLVQRSSQCRAGEVFELDGRQLLAAGEPRATLLLFDGFACRYGIAHDPGRVLPAHGRWGDVEFASVRDLHGPWRAWIEAD